jgi:hypothetical protein
MKQTTRLSIAFVILMLFLGSIQHDCHGFVHRPTATATTTTAVSPTFQRASMVGHAVVDPHQYHSLGSMFDPSLEAESLSIMAHVTLDFSGFVVTPSRSLLRLFAVLGRIFAISADYVVDHSIHTEELVIQLFLISVVVKDWLVDGNTVVAGTNKTAEPK